MAVWKTLKWLTNPRTGARVPYRNLNWTPYLRMRWEIRKALRHPYGVYTEYPQYLPFTEPRYTGRFPVGVARRFTSRKTNPTLSPGLLGLSGLSAPRRRSVLSEFEDRRLWHPEGAFARPKSLTESYPRMMELPPEMAPSWPARFPSVPRRIDFRPKVLEQAQLQPMKYGFANPLKVVICLKRKMRKEVLHALGIAGKTGFRSPKYNAYSHVRC